VILIASYILAMTTYGPPPSHHHTSWPLVEGQKGTVWLGYALFFLNNNLYVSPDSNNIFDG